MTFTTHFLYAASVLAVKRCTVECSHPRLMDKETELERLHDLTRYKTGPCSFLTPLAPLTDTHRGQEWPRRGAGEVQAEPVCSGDTACFLGPIITLPGEHDILRTDSPDKTWSLYLLCGC